MSARTARDWEAAAQLGFDILQLAALLYLTGGIANPFALLIIAPVTLAGASLPTRYAAALAALAIAATVGLAIHALPLPWRGGVPLHLPIDLPHGAGRWRLDLQAHQAFSAGYAHQAAAEAARMELALNVTEADIGPRAEALSALGALAAAAAPSSSATPLATIAVVAKEIAREERREDGPLRDATALLLIAQACSAAATSCAPPRPRCPRPPTRCTSA